MIRKTVMETMERMDHIMSSGAAGDCAPLLEALSETALVCGPQSARMFGREETIPLFQKPYQDTFILQSHHLYCHESKGPFMIVTGEYHLLMKDSLKESTQYMSAVWRQNDQDNHTVLEYLDVHTRGNEEVRQREEKPSILLLDSSGVMVHVKADELLYAASDRNYVNVTLANGEVLHIKSTLHGLLETLNRPQYYQFSRSYIINLDAVQKITKDTVIMSDGTRFNVTIKGRTILRRAMREYRFAQTDNQK